MFRRITLSLAGAFALATLLVAQAAPVFTPEGARIFRSRQIEISLDDFRSSGKSFDDVKEAKLYYTRDGGKNWSETNVGLNEPSGTRDPYWNFIANDDGLYGFYYQLPGQAKPGVGSPIRARVYVDATAPTVRIQSPINNQSFNPGEPIVIQYSAADPNLNRDAGVTYEYSVDDGLTFVTIAADQPLMSSYQWTPPPMAADREFLIQVRVQDKVGNEGRAIARSLRIGSRALARKLDRPAMTLSGPLLGLEEEEMGKIYFEKTDFYYEVDNRTGSPTDQVIVWYTIDNQTWHAGGVNATGEEKGKVSVTFPEGFLRNGFFGEFNHIGFYYQVITQNGVASAEDPIAGTSEPMSRFLVDTKGPHLAITKPALGDKLYRGRIPGNADSGKITFEWTSADLNPLPYVTDLGMERGPVSVWYRPFPSRSDTGWTLVADRLPLKGSFVKDNDLPLGRHEIKVESTDQMGNTTIRTIGPVEIIDGNGYTKPKEGLNDLDVERLWSEATQLYDNAEYKKSIEAYDRALDVAPADRKDAILHDKALALYRDGRITDSTRLLEKVIGHQPENSTFRYSLATIHHRSGDKADAKLQLERILEQDAKEPHIQARSMLANIEHDDGNNDRAVALWKFIAEHASKSSEEYRDAKEKLGKASVAGARKAGANENPAGAGN